jgi:GNAT superfamily N-acetyltransferase
MPTVLAPLLLEEVTQPAQDPFAALDAVLREYNIEQVGPANHIPLWLFARDPAGKVQGGLRGETYWSWCTIDVLAVAKPYRRQGVGSRLLTKAEEIARARGCIGIRLDTTSFQAPDFYHRHGYTEFGRVEDYPPGHARLWFMKKL